MKPTEEAEAILYAANREFGRIAIKNTLNDTEYNLGMGLAHMSVGLINIAVGLRATYLRVEELHQKIDQLNARIR